jgi:hypothetical protein
MPVYLNGQLVIADDALVTGNVVLLGGGAIKTVDNNDLTLLPDGTGITVVGDAGSTSHGLVANDDLFIAGKLEVDGQIHLDGGLFMYNFTRVADNKDLFFGSSSDATFKYDTGQTADALMIGTPLSSESIIIAQVADVDTDFGFPLQSNPTLVIQSADDTTPAQRIYFAHDQTDGVVSADTGDIKISTVANQTLVLVQSVWDDMRVPLLRGITGASNPPAFTQFKDNGAASVGVYAWAFADEAVAGNEDQMWFVTQLPHTYKEGTDIKAHIHWSPAVSGAAGEFVKWGLEYTWQNVDGTFGNTTIIYSDATSAATATTSGDGTLTADKHYVTSIGTITGTSMNLSSMLVCRIFRNSSDASDDLAQAAFAFEVDFHHEVNTLGSRQEFIK